MYRSGPAGPAGPSGPAGPTGQTGQTGAAGVAKAFARVAANGQLSSTGGSISVTRAGTSSYCISGLGFTPKSVITTAAFGDSITNGTFVVDLGSGGAFTGCPMNTQAYVTTFNANGNAIPNSFFLLVN